MEPTDILIQLFGKDNYTIEDDYGRELVLINVTYKDEAYPLVYVNHETGRVAFFKDEDEPPTLILSLHVELLPSTE